MCGIAGIYRRRGHDESDPSRAKAMSDLLTHRGPDDFSFRSLRSDDGVFRTGRGDLEMPRADVCLGHRRLSIIDLSPMG